MPKATRPMTLDEAIEKGIVVPQSKLDQEIDKQIHLRAETKRKKELHNRIQKYLGDRDLQVELVETLIDKWNVPPQYLSVVMPSDISFVRTYEKLQEKKVSHTLLKEPVKAFWRTIRERHIAQAVHNRKNNRHFLGEE